MDLSYFLLNSLRLKASQKRVQNLAITLSNILISLIVQQRCAKPREAVQGQILVPLYEGRQGKRVEIFSGERSLTLHLSFSSAYGVEVAN